MKRIGYIVLSLILAGLITLCVVRWDVWFVNPAEKYWVGDTIDYHFQTFNEDTIYPFQTASEIDFVLLGDVHNSLSNEDFCHLGDTCGALDFYAQLGDFVDRAQPYYIQLLYRSIIGSRFDSIPILCCPGNHEYHKGLIKTIDTDWLSMFPCPQNGPVASDGCSYFVDFQYARFIVIDTDALQLLSDYTRMGVWVRKTIQQAGDKWIIVMMHHPVYASRAGRINPLIWSTFVHSLDNASVIFSGHDHTYARRNDMDADSLTVLPPVWISTSATDRSKSLRRHHHFDVIEQGGPWYEKIHLTSDTLRIETREIRSNILTDIVTLTR